MNDNSSSKVLENWWTDFFESDLRAQVHVKTKTLDETIQEVSP